MPNPPILPVVAVGAGAYLLWFSIHYFGRGGWPTTPIKSVLTGGGVPDAGAKPQTATLAADVTAEEQNVAGAISATDQGATGTETQVSATGKPVITSNSSGTAAQNMALGQLLAGTYGWSSGNDWLCLKTGWDAESGWSTTAANDPSDPYNHAYGIPQANPGTKMASAGPNWKTDAATQITWGLIYIKQTYGSPSQVPHWSPNGPTAGYVGY